MPHILLVHWSAIEAEARATTLRKSGHRVEILADPKAGGYEHFRDDPPAAIVIDLARLPGQGRELGAWLRRNPATRHTPLIFIEGDPAKTERVRALLPDADFTPWSHVRSTLTRALKRKPPEAPMVPGAMDGYSGTPLPKKLGLKPKADLTLLGAPDDFEGTLGETPPGASIKRRAGKPTPVTLLFLKSAKELVRRWPTATKCTADPGRLWICWPKRASGIKCDLTQAAVRAFGLERNWVDFKIAAIDDTWSGLAFTRRKGNPR
jgi:CheY-like chemotaxis protein